MKKKSVSTAKVNHTPKNRISKSVVSQKVSQNMTAIFPGSFDPITLGHIDIIVRLSRAYSQVIVLIAEASLKSQLFNSDERVKLASDALKAYPNVFVKAHKGLTIEFARSYEPSVLVRSLRGMSDFDYERSIAEANRLLDDSIDTYFIFARPEYTGIASSLVKEIAKHGGSLSKFVSPEIETALKKKLKSV